MLDAEPGAVVNEPLRRALDQILWRWLGIFLLAASIAVCPVLCGVHPDMAPAWRAALPLFLVGFIAAHLIRRRRSPRDDGWHRAFEVDPGGARMAVLVGGVAILGVGAALAATFCPYDSIAHVFLKAGLWVPILAPLYAISIWIAADCARRRFGRSAEAADERFRSYWRGLSPR